MGEMSVGFLTQTGKEDTSLAKKWLQMTTFVGWRGPPKLEANKVICQLFRALGVTTLKTKASIRWVFVNLTGSVSRIIMFMINFSSLHIIVLKDALDQWL